MSVDKVLEHLHRVAECAPLLVFRLLQRSEVNFQLYTPSWLPRINHHRCPSLHLVVPFSDFPLSFSLKPRSSYCPGTPHIGTTTGTWRLFRLSSLPWLYRYAWPELYPTIRFSSCRSGRFHLSLTWMGIRYHRCLSWWSRNWAGSAYCTFCHKNRKFTHHAKCLQEPL